MRRFVRRVFVLSALVSSVGSMTFTAPGASAVAPPIVSAGRDHTCAVTTEGAANCWGNNGSGQLGTGNYVSSNVPSQVSGLNSGVAAISAGLWFTCAVTTDGAAKCWGYGNSGQLGAGDYASSNVPRQVSGLTSGVTKVATGDGFSCALTSTGGVKCWGSNYYGQLGDGVSTISNVPVSVFGLSSGVVAISVGGAHACAVTSGGALKCWGYNYFGEIGDGTTNNAATPISVMTGVASVSAGSGHTCAVTTSGLAKCWGLNYSGQLGDGTTTDRLTPVAVSGLSSGITAIAAGGSHTCAATATAGIRCWGGNGDGQLGDGTRTDRSLPVDLPGLSSGITSVSAGTAHSCAVTTSNGIRCWGNGSNGRLGNGGTYSTLTPSWVYGLAGPVFHQPDTTISMDYGSTYIGDGVYNTTAAGQTVSQSVALNEPRFFEVRVQNDGNAPDNFTVIGSAGNSNYEVTYYANWVDVTDSVVAGTYSLSLGISASVDMRVRVLSLASATPASDIAVSLTATSVADTAKKDTVKAVVSITKIYKPDLSVQTGIVDNAYYGNDTNYYNCSECGTASGSPSRGSTATVRFRVQNDGNTPDSYTLLGTGSRTGFTVHYFKGTTDITSAVLDGSYSVTAAAATTVNIRATVKVATSLAVGAKINVDLKATSAGGPSKVDAARAALTASVVLSECVDTKFALNGGHWNKTYKWYIQTSSIPSYLNKTAAISELKISANNITSSRNTCGLSDQVSATNSYQGSTIRNSSLCKGGGADGYNVISFAVLPSGVLGLACGRYNNLGIFDESDMVLNINYRWSAVNGSTCSSGLVFPIQQVATHEFGHVFGLSHPAEDSLHAELTMYWATPCPSFLDRSTLGLGDILGLRKLY